MERKEIFVIETIQAKKNKLKELKLALLDLSDTAKKGKGCLLYEVFEPLDKREELLVIMKYDSLKNLEAHENSIYVANFVNDCEGILYEAVIHYSQWTGVKPG